ncbi:hypothetical protein INT82_01265 [Mannheimia haemolytica]|nr:hypothetical protein [Mannheimia haemolytica]
MSLFFACAKKSNQKKHTLLCCYPHLVEIFLTKNNPDVRFALARVIFLKISSRSGNSEGNPIRPYKR